MNYTEAEGPPEVTLQDDLNDLVNLTGGITPQTRGHRFERWINTLLAHDHLAPHTAFRPSGEEVDGSFMHAGRAYLIEAKWWAEEVPASAIYQFKGKVDGKLVGTIGVFVSMSGYSADSIDALRVGKGLNIVLFDSTDIRTAANIGFTTVLDFKLRQAAEKGEVFVPYIAATTDPQLTVVVEGRYDEEIIRGIEENLRRRGVPTRDLSVIVAQGVLGLSHIAAAAAEARGGDILAIADSDGTRGTIPGLDMLDTKNIELIVVDPVIEKWLAVSSPADFRRLRMGEVRARAADINIDALSAEDPQFARLIQLLTTSTQRCPLATTMISENKAAPRSKAL